MTTEYENAKRLLKILIQASKAYGKQIKLQSTWEEEMSLNILAFLANRDLYQEFVNHTGYQAMFHLDSVYCASKDVEIQLPPLIPQETLNIFQFPAALAFITGLQQEMKRQGAAIIGQDLRTIGTPQQSYALMKEVRLLLGAERFRDVAESHFRVKLDLTTPFTLRLSVANK